MIINISNSNNDNNNNDNNKYHYVGCTYYDNVENLLEKSSNKYNIKLYTTYSSLSNNRYCFVINININEYNILIKSRDIFILFLKPIPTILKIDYSIIKVLEWLYSFNEQLAYEQIKNIETSHPIIKTIIEKSYGDVIIPGKKSFLYAPKYFYHSIKIIKSLNKISIEIFIWDINVNKRANKNDVILNKRALNFGRKFKKNFRKPFYLIAQNVYKNHNKNLEVKINNQKDELTNLINILDEEGDVKLSSKNILFYISKEFLNSSLYIGENDSDDENDEIEKLNINENVIIDYTDSLKVSEILMLLITFKNTYFEKGQIPNFKNKFEINLFNTFRSFFNMNTHFPIKYKNNIDERGNFVEIIRLESGGQVSFSTTKKGITRGNHFHTRKIERFSVIKGKALIQLRKIGTTEVFDYYLSGEEPAYVDIPIWYTHNIKNIGEEELYTMFWINEFYDANDPDTYFEKV
jgi:dTDP-4-dehydrorhamnose 3,5-epimerase-like enzyme